MGEALTLRAWWAAGDWDSLAPVLTRVAWQAVPDVWPLSHDEREDICAGTLVAAWRTATVPDRPAAFVHRAARNRGRDRLRLRHQVERTRVEVPETVIDEAAGPDAILAAAERRQAVARLRIALRRLPPHYRRAVVLRHAHGWGHEAIAARLGVTVGHSRMLVVRGLRALRAAYAATPWPRLDWTVAA